MEIIGQVTFIGPQAVDQQTDFLILFDETASPQLRQVAIIQKLTPAIKSFNLQVNDRVIIDGVAYPISYVGSLVNEQLTAIGHVVLNFGEVPLEPLPNSIYCTGVMPQLKIGSQLIYQMESSHEE